MQCTGMVYLDIQGGLTSVTWMPMIFLMRAFRSGFPDSHCTTWTQNYTLHTNVFTVKGKSRSPFHWWWEFPDPSLVTVCHNLQGLRRTTKDDFYYSWYHILSYPNSRLCLPVPHWQHGCTRGHMKFISFLSPAVPPAGVMAWLHGIRSLSRKISILIFHRMCVFNVPWNDCRHGCFFLVESIALNYVTKRNTSELGRHVWGIDT